MLWFTSFSLSPSSQLVPLYITYLSQLPDFCSLSSGPRYLSLTSGLLGDDAPGIVSFVKGAMLSGLLIIEQPNCIVSFASLSILVKFFKIIITEILPAFYIAHLAKRTSIVARENQSHSFGVSSGGNPGTF